MARAGPPFLALVAAVHVGAPAAGVAAGPCPDLPSLRTPAVASSFNSSLLEGLWYEWAYADPAQAGASCATLNGTAPTADGVFIMAFTVRYAHKIPFTIVEIYTPSAGGERGVFLKHVKEPGGKLLQLPTVFIDVTPSGGGRYATLTVYSCTTKLGLTVEEMLIAGRTPEPPNTTAVAAMASVARSRGAVWDDKAFHTVNRSDCPN